MRAIILGVLVSAAVTASACALELRGLEAAARSGTSAMLDGGRWRGTITVTVGKELEFSVAFAEKAQPQTATMSIPVQGLKDAPLRDVKVDGNTMEFTLGLPQMPQGSWASFKVEQAADGKIASGTMRQSGGEFKVAMTRLADGEQASKPRPQDPKAPVPYTQRDVKYTNPVDGAEIAGTLTIPAGNGAHPAVLLITGSGAQDRNEELLGHRPFLVLADHLTRKGITVLRVDDRGVGGSTAPKHGAETTLDFAGDVAAGVEFLKAQPEVDPKLIGLIGHSEGGLIAPVVASQHHEVAYIVLMAGTGVTGREILEEQMIAMAVAEGRSPESVQKQSVAQKQLLAAAVGGDDAKFDAAMRELVKIQTQGVALKPEELESTVATAKAGLQNPWMKAFLTLDPRPYLQKTTCPVLVLNGSLDKQVLARQNVPEIAKALLDGGNPDFEVHVLPALNHLFQTAKTGGMSEYSTIEETISPVALETMSTWILQHAKAR